MVWSDPKIACMSPRHRPTMSGSSHALTGILLGVFHVIEEQKTLKLSVFFA